MTIAGSPPKIGVVVRRRFGTRLFYRVLVIPAAHRSRHVLRRHHALPVCALSGLGALLLPACDGDDGQAASTTSTVVATTTTVPVRENDGALNIGVFLPRTGPGAALGEPMINAITAAVSEINAAGGVLGRDVALRPLDENSSTGMEDLLAVGIDGAPPVDAIVGPASSTVALSQLGTAVNPVNGVVTCSPSATALALDDYPDPRNLFFRTVPSDSLEMAAIALTAARTGEETVAVGYLDDPYGRGLSEEFVVQADRRGLDVLDLRGFGADQDDLSEVAAQLVADDPGVLVVLGNADDGARLLAALDLETRGSTPPLTIVNDAIRGNRTAIQPLSAQFRDNLSGVAPRATTMDPNGPPGFFAANAEDCVNLIALAAVQAGSDDPIEIQKNMAAVSAEGQPCTTFNDCAALLSEELTIDYDGATGDVELEVTTGELVRGRFEKFVFDQQGIDQLDPEAAPFEVSKL